ncbi:MAG: (p)ppGpp synthetase SpoT/RelA, pyrophosphokinase, partial [Candidatus Berkelbacteria bacterium]|nr:(p)ppGpp synthetase SpoT/RelA, pyrophosphokinase [Candidatus Berkelbacteria bacterium]
KYLEKIEKILRKKMAIEEIKADIHGRAKHLYSLWRKLGRYDNDLSHIYDLVALRIIVNSVADCYKVLGIIHETWKPLVGRIKDYIAMPKPNGYQSLHTTVFCLDGKIVEFQIRTKIMHDQAENGIAAGWHYAEAKGTLDYILKKIKRAPYEDVQWVKELARWQDQSRDNKQFSNDIQIDFFSDRIFVYTPQGEVKDLPAGATPIDFAYSIHSEVGNSCVGAKINGKMSTFSTPLKNGDIVEIIKSKRPAGPKHDWLEFVKTSMARNHIRRYLRLKNI